MSSRKVSRFNPQNKVISTLPDHLSQKEQIKILKQFSSSNYYSLSWKLDKMNRDKNPYLCKTIHFEDFKNFPKIILELKEWLIYQLFQGLSEKSILHSLTPFREMLEQNLIQVDSLFEIDKKVLIEYYFSLELNRTDILNESSYYRWNELKYFYKVMGLRDIWKWMNCFFQPERKGIRCHQDRIISEEVIEKLDWIFYHEELPISFKLCYWILRLIPNRMEEVISIPFDCITLTGEDSYILKLPTFKQAGGYAKAQWRKIYFKNEGLGAYLKKLIQDQQKYLKDRNYQSKFLIADCIWRYQKNSFKCISLNNINPFHLERFNHFLKRIIKIYNIRNKEGNLVHITSHMFRHNAVTERIDSGLFSFHDIKLMSGHHTTTMLEIAYNHPDFNKSKETVLSYEEEVPDFKGKVLPGATEEDFRKLASRPYAREIDGLGVCRDVRGCKAQYYKCYGCEHFKIESKDPDRLKEEKVDWEGKKLLAQRAGDKKFEEECDSNINGINILLERIKNER